MDISQTLRESGHISTYLLKYLFWRPLGKAFFSHTFAFEDMPFFQAVSMLGSTLAFTHSKNFYLLTYAYDWKQFNPKKDPLIHLGVIGGTAQSAGMFMMSQKKHPHVELMAVASRTPKRGQECAKKYDLSKAYSPYDQLLDDPFIDSVVVFSPISTHEKLIIKILESGKHCIIVPPLAANSAQIKRIMRHKHEHHPNLLCTSVYAALAHPVNHEMRDLIRSGAIGSVQRVVIRANWPSHAFHSKSIQFDYASAGGAWEDLGPHAVTLARFMLDDNHSSSTTLTVKSASASVPSFASDVDETMSTTLVYGDIQVEIEVSLVKSMDTSIEVKGTEGQLRQTQWYRAEMYNKLIHRKADGTIIVTEHRGKGDECGKASWEYWLDYLVHAFRTLEAPLFGSCEEELRTMEVVDEVYRKAGLGERCPTVAMS